MLSEKSFRLPIQDITIKKNNMKLPLEKTNSNNTTNFYTGVRSLIDRRIGSINMLSIHEILKEKAKLNNIRNGKVRP